jgi:ribosomal protein L32
VNNKLCTQTKKNLKLLTYKTNAIKKSQTHTCSHVAYRHTNTIKKTKKDKQFIFLKLALKKIELKT